MAHIYVGFSSPKKFKIGAAGIQWWTNSPYSHVYIRFVSSNEGIPSNVYHAAHGMVNFREFENFKKENNVVFEYCLFCEDKTRIDVLSHCMYLSGEGYGYTELIKIFITDIANYCGIKFKSEDGRGYICSELVGTILTKHFNIQFNKPMNLLKPSDIYKALEY